MRLGTAFGPQGPIIMTVLLAMPAWAASPDALRSAAALYEHTEYRQSLQVLAQDPTPDAAAYLLNGKNYFMLADYKRATDLFEKAAALGPSNSEYQLWLGRAWGRRAETGGWLSAPAHASRARQ